MNDEKNSELTGFEIAVIGMAARFPGAANIDEYWENLKQGIENVRFFTDEELTEAGVAPELINDPNYVKGVGFLEGTQYFDYSFFDFTPLEASIMDPQIRIFLECAWNALEDAGYSAETYNGLIGVYGGASSNLAWESVAVFGGGDGSLDPWSAAKLADKDYLCTQVSYKLNLRGPSFPINTACSTSLVATHLAAQALLNGECDMALAGGVNATILKKRGYMSMEGMVTSTDGRTRAFDAQAGGVGIGNGVGIVVLKRLDDALAQRDHIYVVLKGSAINNDGSRKAGFTAPSVEGQVEAIRAAQMMAEVDPESIGCIEAHGTGTPLGDPVEIEALKLAFQTEKHQFCPIGSVKTNFGHLDAAAGVAGLIKAALAIKHRLIPPSLNFQEPNPNLDLENSPFYVNTELSEWKNGTQPRRAGVSSFGIGGTNSHAILEEAPPLPASSASRPFQLLLLSAKTIPALDRVTKKLADCLETQAGIDLADAAYTLQTGRTALPYRRMTVCRDIAEARRHLSSADGENLFTGLAPDKKQRLVFMFSGQGAQYVDMGRGLYLEEPYFREEADRCFDILKSITGTDFKTILFPDEQDIESAGEKINDMLYSGPIKLLSEYSLAKLLMKYGVRPHAMIGHSFGEYTAACLSGVFSLEDAFKLAVKRGQIMHDMPEGAMMSVPLPEDQLKEMIEFPLAIAVVNGSNLCVISGPTGDMDRLEKELEGLGHECLRFNVPVAAHSKMLVPYIEGLLSAFREVTLNTPQIPYISGNTGGWISRQQAVDPEYWGRHMTETIRFADGIGTLIKEVDPIFIQLGSDRGLPLFVSQHPRKEDRHLAINMVRHPRENESDLSYLLNKIGQLWLAGTDVNWEGFYYREERSRIVLPTYPFERVPIPVENDMQAVISRLQSEKDNSGDPGKMEDFLKQKPAANGDTGEYARSFTRKRPDLKNRYSPPRDEMEEVLVQGFQRFFRIEPVGIYDDFYELGGDSLRAVQLANAIRRLNIDITFKQILIHQNIHDICMNLTSQKKEGEMSMESIERSLSEKYDAHVSYRTYPAGGVSYRVLFLVRESFGIEKVLDDIAGMGVPAGDLYPNFVVFVKGDGDIPEPGNSDPGLLARLLSLKEQVGEEDLAHLRQELDKNTGLTDLLKENGKTCRYEASPLQKNSLIALYEHFTMNLIYFSHEFSYPTGFHKIEDIVKTVIEKNSLLRSVIAAEEGNYFIDEYAGFDNIQLPFIDISSYSPACRDEIGKLIMKRLMEPIDLLDNVLFRIAVLKIDHARCRLIFMINHLISDGTSSIILASQLQSLLRERKEIKEDEAPVNSYRDYVHFLQGQDYGSVQQELEKYINLDHYFQSNKEISKRYKMSELKVEEFKLDISIINEMFKDYYEEIILLTYAKLIRRLFEIDRVPLIYTSSGRVYKDGTFNGIIGDFADLVPVLLHLDVDKGPGWLMKNFIEYRAFIRENNLNFFNYGMKGFLQPPKDAPLNSPFVLNSLTGFEHAVEKMRSETQETELGRGEHTNPSFFLMLDIDYHAKESWQRFVQNSGFTIKEIFIENFHELVNELNETAAKDNVVADDNTKISHKN